MVKICRLGVFNKEALNRIGRNGLKTMLDHLEKACGGHGNGIAMIDEGQCTFAHKGVKFSNQEIVDIVFNSKVPEWLLYHTRIASKGSIKDSNCHPYWNEDKSFVLAMNGTVGQFGDLAKSLDITDTELVFKNLDTFGIDIENLTELSPRFIGFKDGKVFATNPKGFGGLEYVLEDGALIIASCFPKDINSKKLKEKYVWYSDTEPEEQEIRVVSYGRGCYGTAYGSYDDEWHWGKKIKQNNYSAKEEVKKKEDLKEIVSKKYTTDVLTEIDIFDTIDVAREYLGIKDVSKEDIEDYIKEELGTLKPHTTNGNYTILVGDDDIALLDCELEVVY